MNESIRLIQGHIRVLNHELGEVQASMASIRTDIAWLKKIQWAILAAIIAAAVAQYL